MLPQWLAWCLMVLTEAWSARRDAQLRFLKLQIELLRQKLPGDRVILSPEDRLRLLRAGEQMGHQVCDVIDIVSVKTYRQWVREQRAGVEPGRVGRPRMMSGALRALILQLARENPGWGVRRGDVQPDDEWMPQQARNATLWAEEEGIELRFLLRDRDAKYTYGFDDHFRTAGAKIIRTPFKSPIANCYAESWVGSLKRECLNALWCFGLRYFDHVVQTYVRYYNTMRPHQSLGNVPLCRPGEPPPAWATHKLEPVRRERLLGGLLNHYERKAA